MAVIQTGAEVVVVDMATITQVKITKVVALGVMFCHTGNVTNSIDFHINYEVIAYPTYSLHSLYVRKWRTFKLWPRWWAWQKLGLPWLVQ